MAIRAPDGANKGDPGLKLLFFIILQAGSLIWNRGSTLFFTFDKNQEENYRYLKNNDDNIMILCPPITTFLEMNEERGALLFLIGCLWRLSQIASSLKKGLLRTLSDCFTDLS